MLSADVLHQIEAEYPCRTSELKLLNALLHLQKREHDPSSAFAVPPVRAPGILIYGPSQSGKTSILKQVFERSDEHNYAYIDCRKCISERSLFEYTIDELYGQELIVGEDGDFHYESRSIDNLALFLSSLQQALSQPNNIDKIVVFDHISSTLYEELNAIISSVVRLLTSSSSNHTAVFVMSSYEDIPQEPMTTLRFPVYSQDELCLILQETTDIEIDIEGSTINDAEELRGLWDRLCKTFMSAFFDAVGQDIVLYRAIAVKLFPKYLQPIKDNILSVKNHVQLARSAQPLLVPETWILAETSLVQTTSNVDRVRVDELSISARYLLIAAFLASYNPGKTDRTFFSRGKGEKTRRRAGKRGVERIAKQAQKLLGPKGFSLERMLSIFQAIITTTYRHTALMDQQIATLYSLKLITKQGASSDLLDDGKWVVNVNFETIIKIARSVDFELNRFLVSD